MSDQSKGTEQPEISDKEQKSNAGQSTAAKSRGLKWSLGCLGLIVSMIIIGLLLPPEPKDVTKTGSTPEKVKTAPSVDAKKIKADSAQFAKDMLDGTVLCDVQSTAVMMNLQGGDDVGAYQAAGKASEYCNASEAKLAQMSVPEGLPEKVDGQFHAALDACSNALAGRAGAFSALQAALDRGSVSDRATLRESVDSAAAQMSECENDITQASLSAGLSKAEVKGLMGKD